ncbi:9216_t:CDS:2 [Funneliformis caledonium]|uniref:9216_t:CDS:1 n=1 Tax=Funneliformis caledonium TaxID=1117310 RepID=A0A9N9A896_9GLOM|nr:9216_t:CDS:2 [Funneliformis caledonium]
MKNLCLENTENTLDACQNTISFTNNLIPIASALASDAADVAQNFALFAPLINSFLELGKEIIKLYEKAEHNKNLCSFLLQRCNCAVSAIKDLDIRKTEHANFFSKQENLELFTLFIKCMKRIKKFIADVSQLSKLKKYILANNIEDTFTKLVEEFEGCMNSFNFSFTMQSREELITIKDEIKQLRNLLLNINGSTSNDKQSHDEFFKGVDAVTGKNKEFQKQNRHTDANSSDLITCIDKDEPLLDGSNYLQTGNFHSKKIEERISKNDFQRVSFKEFSNNSSSSVLDQNISHNIENVRYMAPEKLLIDESENNTTQGERANNDMKRKKVPYDSKCEIYSVGALLWEIAELKKPHSDLSKSEMLVSIRKRVRDKYREPLSAEVPDMWKYLVKMGK